MALFADADCVSLCPTLCLVLTIRTRAQPEVEGALANLVKAAQWARENY